MGIFALPVTPGALAVNGAPKPNAIVVTGEQREQIDGYTAERGVYRDVYDLPSPDAYGTVRDVTEYGKPRTNTQASRFFRYSDMQSHEAQNPPYRVQARDLIRAGLYQTYERPATDRSEPFYGLVTNPYVKTGANNDTYNEMTPQARIAQNRVTFDVPNRVRRD